MIKGLSIRFLFFVILCVSINAYAHDTTHIHPLITAEIARLIKNIDSGDSYLELYQDDSVQM